MGWWIQYHGVNTVTHIDGCYKLRRTDVSTSPSSLCLSSSRDEPQQQWRKYSDPLIVNNSTQTTLLKYSVTSTIPAFDNLLQ